jgi:outer membrane protein W
MVASAPVLAGEGEMILRFGAACISPTGDYAAPFDLEGWVGVLTQEADASLGGFVGFEYMVSDRVGVDATLLSSNHDIEWTEIGTEPEPFDVRGVWGDISMMPLIIGANFHVKRTDALDFYMGPSLAYVMYGDLDATFGPEHDACVEDDFGFGAVVGLDVAFGGSGWTFSTALRYLQTGADVDEDPHYFEPYTLDVNPVILQVGVGKKW